jgi:hypothetical protein
MMRKLILAFALASVALPLASCATVKTASDAVALANENVGDFTVMDERAFWYSGALYDVPATAYLALNRRGLLHDPLKSQLKSMLQDLNRYRVAARDAYHAGNSVTFHEKLVAMKALSDEVRRLLPSQSAQAQPIGIPSASLAASVALS